MGNIESKNMTNGDFIRSMTDEGEKIDSSADIICPQKKLSVVE